MATKTNPREQMLALVKQHGWVLNPEKKIPAGRFSRERIQDPHAFARPAVGGGTWSLRLDYSSRGDFSISFGGVLRSVDLQHVPPDGFTETDDYYARQRTVRTLKRPSPNYDRFVSLWVVTANGDPDRPLRQRAELIIENPDLVAWLAAEAEHNHTLKVQAEEKARQHDAAMRRRPLPNHRRPRRMAQANHAA
jgi:hypothetical protein